MLNRLEIHNYVLIDSLDITFPEGLVIISGQTGAGKSILLGALSLLAGGKADASQISEGADSCVVEAEFMSVDSRLKSAVEDAGAEWDDAGLIVRRVVARSGRSRAFINDCPVTVQTLVGVTSRLFDIHSQHGTLELQNPAYQTDMLDNFAGNLALRNEYSESYSRLSSLNAEKRRLEESLERLRAEKDYNMAQFSQLDSAGLKDGELAELEQEQKELANAETIRESLYSVSEALSPSDEELPSVDSLLKESVKALEKISAFVPSAGTLAERIESSRLELDDILSEVTSLAEKSEASPQRLETVEARMSLIYGLFQKFGCTSEAELISLRDKYSEALADTDCMDEKLAALSSDIASESKNNDRLAAALTESRQKAATPFSEHLQSMIRSLEMPLSVFIADVSPAAKPGPLGRDNVRFLFSSTGRAPIPVQSCASGGELSRIMLCLKAQMAHFEAMPTLIFDEIDTGVSGSVADKMGSMICSMGADMQVFAITHLPQVAAKGSAHYLVEKAVSSSDGRTTSSIRKLTSDERVLELARMLSGSTVTPAAIANAKELLGSSIQLI